MYQHFVTTTAKFVLATLIFAAPIFAQSPRLVINIDHEFTVGTVTFPAGKYTIARALPNHERLFLIESLDAKYRTTQFAVPQDSDTQSDANVFTFSRYGDEYFLTSIRTAGDERVFTFNVSARERDLLSRRHQEPELINIRASNGH